MQSCPTWGARAQVSQTRPEYVPDQTLAIDSPRGAGSGPVAGFLHRPLLQCFFGPDMSNMSVGDVTLLTTWCCCSRMFCTRHPLWTYAECVRMKTTVKAKRSKLQGGPPLAPPKSVFLFAPLSCSRAAHHSGSRKPLQYLSAARRTGFTPPGCGRRAYAPT